MNAHLEKRQTTEDRRTEFSASSLFELELVKMLSDFQPNSNRSIVDLLATTSLQSRRMRDMPTSAQSL